MERIASTSVSTDLIKLLASFGLEACFLIPTATGLEKSILDATRPLREFFRLKKIHDYAQQGLGGENKRKISGVLLRANSAEVAEISLYRPQTKSGDPRIWISKLGSYAKPLDVLALVWHDAQLWILNASDKELLDTLSNPNTPLGKIALESQTALSSPSEELLGKLRKISERGFIPSIREGSTGVGATLEALLGIKANSSKKPDFKGIEIKASRQLPKEKKAKNRVNLFSQVPNWKESPVGSAASLLSEFGYLEKGRLQLYCTLSALKENSLSLMLAVDENEGHIKLISVRDGQNKFLAKWGVNDLMDRLSEKHPESFWIKTESKKINGVEHFRYYHVLHTVSPLVSNLPYLIADGTITLDLTMSAKGRGVRDHGYLFKVWPSAFDMIFPSPRDYSLEDRDLVIK